MNENATKRIRRSLTGSIILAAVLSLIGAVGYFVYRGIVSSGNTQRDNMVLYTVIGVTLWDLVRLGSFGMFAGSLILTVCELFGNVRGKYCSIAMVGGSVFGLIGAIKMSLGSIMTRTMGMLGSVNSYYSENNLVWSVIFLPCIFAMTSAIVIFISVGIRSALENGTYAPSQSYPQYPRYQQYPQNGQMPYVQPPQVPAAQQMVQQQQMQHVQQQQAQQFDNNDLNGRV